MRRIPSWPAAAVVACLAVAPAMTLPAALAPARAASVPAAPPGGAVPPIRLDYALYGHGFHVMDVTVDLLLTPDAYSLRLNDHTVGLLGFMLRANVTSTAQGRFVGDGVRPVRFTSIGYSRGAQRQTQLDYVDGNPSVTVLAPPETRRDPVPIAQARGSVDTLSAIADLMRRVERSGRCDGNALVFDGLRLTRARSQTTGQQTVPQDHGAAYGGTALRCDFVSQQVAGFLHNDDEAQLHRPQHGTAWINRVVAGAPPLPVRIMFEHPKLGLATMVLTRVEAGPPSPPSPGG
ncbi:DUF3108 domain-containing protein [Lichenicoccus sp.]|uniref:DUF3108 domain-containing protein n=1 Tax=Lichenicoccus sp. TaxID=2781899 RepID=UPI003D0E783A